MLRKQDYYKHFKVINSLISQKKWIVLIIRTGRSTSKQVLEFIEKKLRTNVWFNLFHGRGTIHPLIPNMAIVGYVESVSNLNSSELRSMWLSHLVDDKFKLPSIEKMLSHTLQEMEVMKRSTRFYKRHCISTYSINHSDDLCEDMGWSSYRKKSWISEVLAPYAGADYKEDWENKLYTWGMG